MDTPCLNCTKRTERNRRLPGCTTPCGDWFDWNMLNVSKPVEIKKVAQRYSKKMMKVKNG